MLSHKSKINIREEINLLCKANIKYSINLILLYKSFIIGSIKLAYIPLVLLKKVYLNLSEKVYSGVKSN